MSAVSATTVRASATSVEATASAAVETASAPAPETAAHGAVEAAATRATLERSTAVEAAAVVESLASIESAAEITSPEIAATVKVTSAEPEVVTIAEAASVESVEPRAGADEESTVKPFWTVITVWRASVRIIVVVTVIANWRWAIVHGPANAYADRNSLRVCAAGCKQADTQNTD